MEAHALDRRLRRGHPEGPLLDGVDRGLRRPPRGAAREEAVADRLAPPRVAPEVYDAAYYRGVAAGHAEWARGEAAGVYHGALHLAGVRPGEVVLDVGTGRGELLAVAIEAGAARAIGVDYSADAVALARATLTERGVAGSGASVELADARALPVAAGSVDAAFLLDVVEHLSAPELARTLDQVRAALRPGGRLLVHTMPNRLIYDVTYRALRLVARRWPTQPRNGYELSMHVNEQTRRSLRAALAGAGFADVTVGYGPVVLTQHLPSARVGGLMRRAARLAPLRPLVAGDLIARAGRPA